MRISLRELLIGVALVAVAMASLKYANDVWLALVAGLTMLALFAVLIVGVVDRGRRQAFAMGFGLTMIAYGFVLLTGIKSNPYANGASRNLELDQWEGRLPTTRLLRYVHMAVNRSAYFDAMTGKEVPDYDPATDPKTTPISGFPGAGMGPSANYRELPPREFFMPIGHCWWALSLGYVGGLFATWVYMRRMTEAKSESAAS